MPARKNQAVLTPDEWQTLIDAINQTHGVNAAPLAYRGFVQVHEAAMSAAGMAWSVHTMPGMGVGRNFLAWHRQYLVQFEKRLQVVHPTVICRTGTGSLSRLSPRSSPTRLFSRAGPSRATGIPSTCRMLRTWRR